MVENEPNFWQRLVMLNPAVLRGLILGIFGLVAIATGAVVDQETVDKIIDVILLLLTVISGFVIKGAVTPNAKVLVFKPDPIDAPNWIAAGEATSTPEQSEAVVTAAESTVPRAA